MAFGRSASMLPNYSRAKEAAKNIMKLIARQSQIDPDNENEGKTLVSFLSKKNFEKHIHEN